MAVLVQVLDEKGLPVHCTVAAVRTSDQTILALYPTNSEGVAEIVQAGTWYPRPMVTPTYKSRLKMVILNAQDSMNADYVVDAGGGGTHIALHGAGGALADAIASGVSKFIWVCASHTENVTTSQALTSLATSQRITVASGGRGRGVVTYSHNSAVLTIVAPSAGSDSRLRFERIRLVRGAGNSGVFIAATGGPGLPTLEFVGVDWGESSTAWTLALDVSGSGSATVRGLMFEDCTGSLNAFCNTSSAGAATGPFRARGNHLSMINGIVRSASTNFEVGNSYLFTDNDLTLTSYLLQRTFSSAKLTVSTNTLRHSGAQDFIDIGTAASTGVSDVSITGNNYEATAVGARFVDISPAAGAGSNISIASNALDGPGSGTAINISVALTTSYVNNGYRDWTTTVGGAGAVGIGGDHGLLSGLSDDDHNIYALLAGRVTGQTVRGGTAADENLVLESTAHATKGRIQLGSSTADGTRVSVNGTLDDITLQGVNYKALLGVTSQDGTLFGSIVNRMFSATTSPDLIFTRATGTPAAPVVVALDNYLGDVVYAGYDGTDYEIGARITGVVDGTVSGTALPGRLTFWTTPAGSNTPLERMRIGADGGARVLGFMRVGSLVAPTNVTDGDLTIERLRLANDVAFGATAGRYIGMYGTMTDTAPGAVIHSFWNPTIAPVANSSSEFRTLYFQSIIAPASGVAIDTVQAIYGDNRWRSDALGARLTGLLGVGAVLDSSSPATTGTLDDVTGVMGRIGARPSGTSTGRILRASYFATDQPAFGGMVFNIARGYWARDHALGGAVDYIQFDAEKPSGASGLLVGVRNAGRHVMLPAAATNITAVGNTIPSDAELVKITASASFTLTSTPSIANGQADGQRLYIMNEDTVDTVTLQDESALPGSNVRSRTAANIPLAPREIHEFVWSSVNTEWYDVGSVAPVGGGGGGGTATTVEVDLGSTAKSSGKFTITDAAIGAASKVLVWQAPGPYTGKGTLADEAAAQPVNVIAAAPAAGSCVVYWETPPIVAMVREVQQAHSIVGGTTFDRLDNQRWPDVFIPRRHGKVRGNVKFTYMVLT